MTAKHPPPPEIPGDKAQGDLLRALRSEVAALLSRDSPRFPGAQPVSFAAKHLHELVQQDYYVCEKSDGIRCLMYLTRDREGKEVTYLIDRKNDYYWVQNLHFPLPESEQSFHVNTLIDGELVNDREPNGSIQLRYLVFDCLTLDGSPLLHRTLDKRLAYYRDKVFEPYIALYNKYPEEKQYLPFVVEFKKMEKAYGIVMLFRDILPNLPHGNDGLIFTCRNTPYKPGTDPNILKWKPANENSVDFRLNLDIPLCDPDSEDEQNGIRTSYPDYSAMPGFCLSVGDEGNRVRPWGTMFVTANEWEELKQQGRPLDEAVVECYQDAMHRWRFMRFRDDKHEPNHISTVESVMESIQDRIEEGDLIAVGKAIRDAWKAREMKEQQAMALARKNSGAPADGPQNGTNGGNRDTQSAQKRKLGVVDGVDGREGGDKRRITPQPGNGVEE
ncbi:Dcp1p-Dcp2p decapping enzyme complex alpha subunit [Thelotrema lepadinum]|nr:Dcp1p-Dcp2p decapping enzyme complex alpha subunit [Thelotrema lepadinum]